MSDGNRTSGTGLGGIVEGHVRTETIPAEEAQLDRPLDPCTFVIIGASGDLTSRKLIPSLFQLYSNNGLPEHFSIVGCGRTAIRSEEFRKKLKIGLGEEICSDTSEKDGGKCSDTGGWKEFSARLHYRRLVYDSADSFRELANYLRKLDKNSKTGGNRIFYLATPMFLYGNIARLLGEAGLSVQHQNGNGWARIVVEKPYGSDRKSAAELDRVIHESFEENQIFRIDHYLAKETVRNILMFRFANSIFEPLWNRDHVDHVDIIAAESLGVEKRAGYYEKSGVLRDMFQNHMMQLLALTAMEPPESFSSDAVHNEKVRVFESLVPFPTHEVHHNLVLGQYGPGIIDGVRANGYRQEEGVDPGSLTPTFGMMKVFLDNDRWRGVPFYITSGKRLGRKLTEIVIKFRKTSHPIFRDISGGGKSGNLLTLGIQPDEHISLKFQTKSPGAKPRLRSVTMDFNYLQGYDGPVLAAYEKALLDCMKGDRMLFWRQDGIDLTWKFMEPLLHECELCSDRAERLKSYEAGSWGPGEAVDLKLRD